MVAHSSTTASAGPVREALLPSLSSLVAQTKESTCNAGDLGLIPGSGRSPGEGNGNPLQYSCLVNPMDRGATGYSGTGYWRATVHAIAKSQTQHSN